MPRWDAYLGHSDRGRPKLSAARQPGSSSLNGLINFWKVSKIAQRHDSGGSILGFITAPYRHLSVTESVALPPDLRRSIMPSRQLKLVDDQTRYTNSQLLQLRRQMLRYARSWPRGSSERNQRRQTAASLRSLSKNTEWLDAHTVFLIREYHRDRGDRLRN